MEWDSLAGACDSYVSCVHCVCYVLSCIALDGNPALPIALVSTVQALK